MSNHDRGFTLLEVLIALSIISIAITAILLTISSSIKNTERVIQHNMAHMVSEQILHRIQLHHITTLPNAVRPLTETFFDKTWSIKAASFPTTIPHVYRIEVSAKLNKQDAYFSPISGYAYFDFQKDTSL